MTLKKNRSNKFTIGLCNTFKDNTKLRTLFFELDREHMDEYEYVNKVYQKNKLDYFVHKTGSGGFHFISPTMITKARWNKIMKLLKSINPKCPMTTLRVKPNKYYNEDQFWYFTYIEKHYENREHNSRMMCNYFNRIFKTHFKGALLDEIIIVQYPLPFVKEENVWIK